MLTDYNVPTFVAESTDYWWIRNSTK